MGNKQFKDYEELNQYFKELMERYFKFNNEHMQYITENNHLSVHYLQHQKDILVSMKSCIEKLFKMISQLKYPKNRSEKEVNIKTMIKCPFHNWKHICPSCNEDNV